MPCPQSDPARDGFRLDAGQGRFGLGLDKRGRRMPTSPCIFLVSLGGGHDRCGVYADRPVVCRTYPTAMTAGLVGQREDVLCPPASWPEPTLRRPSWRVALQRQRMHFDLYYEVVARWNAWAATMPARQSLPFGFYLDYLINVYERIAILADEEDQAGPVAAAVTTWGQLPAAEADGTIRLRPGQTPWVDYLMAARGVIDSFFPEIEPQPLMALNLAAANPGS